MIKNQIIIGFISIIVVILLILSVVIVFLGSDEDNGNGGTIDSRFVGEWLDEDRGDLYEFKSNGSFYDKRPSFIYYIGTWSVKGDQLCVTEIESDGTIDEDCYNFEFSNDDKTLTLYGEENNPLVVYTKQ